ncbi:MAG TPA: YhbY family RNA-binding protein [Candidatus Nanoarchaeia archaeon]|nr:YhbY family RNA-binding protein [Candidatus Nanoarchaeia archaeon]
MNREKSKARSLEPSLRIGKNGLSSAMVKEIKSQLDKRGLVKIKMLKSYTAGKDKNGIVGEITEKTNAKVVESVGNIILLQKFK